jgi:hypothetical protein
MRFYGGGGGQKMAAAMAADGNGFWLLAIGF